MHILIVGHRGQLGTELMHCLQNGKSELGAIPAVCSEAKLTGVDIDTLDITDREATLTFVKRCKPDVILNCAAYTNVDGCESHQDEAFRVNAIGPRNLAMAAEAFDAKLLHVSTDYVFEGIHQMPRSEYDQTNPLCVYGKTKLQGEHYVQGVCSRAFIVRTAWLYGYYGNNFVKAILKKAAETGSVKVVNDQFGNPTNAADLAHHILKIAATEEYGIYHCTGGGTCSWFEFAQEIVRLAGAEAMVMPCTTDEYPTPTKRPKYSALEHRMLRCTVGDEMRPWREALNSYFMRMQEASR